MRWLACVSVVVVIIILAASAGCLKHGSGPGTDGVSPRQDNGSAVLAGNSGQAPGDHVFALRHDNLQRSYLVHVPPSYSGERPVPVILVFHGGGDDVYGQVKQSGMTETSDREGFLAVFPQGTGTTAAGKVVGTWNAGRCCGSAKAQNIDDVGFVNALLDDLGTRFSIDTDRMYATGISNGALFTYRLACEIPDRIAAVAPVAGQDAFDDCRPSRPVSVIHFHGTADPAALYAGGRCGGRLPGDPGWSCVSVPDYIGRWVSLGSCSGNPVITFRNNSATCRTYGNCSGGAEMTLCTIEGGGHTWPGGRYLRDERWWKEAVGNISYDISANDMIWDFFTRHPLSP
jgi:polyhydroxybutyrate depolymerase